MMAASNHDDLDMVKLQKQIRQQQRRSVKARSAVSKLTPAEIRSLNHSVAISKEGGSQASHRSTPSQGQSLNSNTPPLTPDNVVANQKQHLGNANANLPTPPHSPDTAHEARRNSNPTNGHTHIHAPKPHPYSTAQFVARGPTSRPSSASSYRGMQTYRGPEVTRTGSLTMIHQPPPNIVSNPLSQFSRPRRSQTSSSPERRDSRRSVASVGQDRLDVQSQSPLDTSNNSLRTTSPQKGDELPVTASEAADSMGFPSTVHDGTTRNGTDLAVSANPAPEDGRVVENMPSNKSWSWRKSMNQQRPDVVEPPATKPNRRHTLSFSNRSSSTHSVPYSVTKQGTAPILIDTLKGDLPSDKSHATKDLTNGAQKTSNAGFGAHPGVRPLNLDIPGKPDAKHVEILPVPQNLSSDPKGKGRDVEEMHVYGRCSCCGKMKKPNGFHSELSPVIENENLRTNFNFEADRTSIASRRRSSSVASSNRRKYTPIIPMSISKDRTVQATIEPYREVFADQPEDINTTDAEPFSDQSRRSMDPKVVRFSSLHGMRELVAANEARMASENVTNGTNEQRDLDPIEKPQSIAASEDQNHVTEIVPIVVSPQTSTAIPILHSAGVVEHEPIPTSKMPQDSKRDGSSDLRGRHVQIVEPESTKPGVSNNLETQEAKVAAKLEAAKQKALIQDAAIPKGTTKNKSKTKEKIAATQVKEVTPTSALNSKAVVKHQTVPGQTSNSKSPQKSSPFSIFKRHRKTTSEPESTTTNVPLAATPPKPAELQKPTIVLTEATDVPGRPKSAHSLVTMIPPNGVADPVIKLPAEDSGPILVPSSKSVSPFGENTATSTVHPHESIANETNRDLPATPTPSPNSSAEPLEAGSFSTSDEDPFTEPHLHTATLHRVQTPAQPWPLPETPIPTMISTQTHLTEPEPEAESDQILLNPPTTSSDSKYDFLPMLHMGPHFARSNATLRDFVIPHGKSSTNLIGLALSDVKEEEMRGTNSHSHSHMAYGDVTVRS